MLNRDKRIRIVVGHYGSGKSEFAVNYAVKLHSLGKKVMLCDLDIVNPYFRSRELANELEADGIRVISSALGNYTNLDIPMISAEINRPLVDKSVDAVFDLGGDHVGAKVLVQFYDNIVPEETDVFFIFNAYREMTQDCLSAYYYMRKIEDAIQMKITAIVNNTHLLHDTTTEDLIYGQKIAEELSQRSGVPVRYVSGIESALRDFPIGDFSKDGALQKFSIEMLMRESWQRREYG